LHDSTPEHETPNGENPFPDESEWLDLPCPEVSLGFVEDTWRYVRANLAPAGATAGDEADAPDPDAIELPRELLDAYTVPPPSPGFVDATWAAARASAWQRALAHNSVPEPTPDFVERVLRSLREQRDPARTGRVLRGPASWRAPRFAWAAAVAAAILLAVVWLVPGPDASLPFEVVSSRDFSPDRWAVTMTSLHDRGLASIPDDPSLRLGELAGLARPGGVR
jgi:hypothetical protein